MKAGSNLEKVLSAGHFAVTGELGPPQGNNAAEVRHKASFLKGIVESVNITDNQTAMVRMASWATSLLAKQLGLEPNYQMVVRDRNRLAMQADILGATALGITTMLCLSGDHPRFGDHPEALGVNDLDSMGLIAMVKKMRDEKKFLSGADLQGAPRVFIGAAANPFGDPFELRVMRLAKKVQAGADFVQTQCIYNMKKFRDYMHQAHEMGLTEKCYVLAGLTPLKSGGMANYMATKVPGLEVPPEIVKRLKGVPKESQTEEGIKLFLEQVEEMKTIPGVAGVHVMAIEWEHMMPEIMKRTGLLPRP